MYPFELFSESAKGVLMIAKTEAETAGVSYIGVEHLLVALMLQKDALSHAALTRMGFDGDAMRLTVATAHQSGKPLSRQQIIPTSHVKRVIEYAFESARSDASSAVDTGYLLLAVVEQQDELVAQILAGGGVTRESARSTVDKLRRDGVTDASRPTGPGPMPQRYHFVADARGLTVGLDILFPAEYSAQQRSELMSLIESAIRKV
jgi:ATP-dependent Clp protease ATP-binding subunit ClpC